MSARSAQRPIFHTKGMLGRAERDEIGFGGFTSPKSLDRVLEFLIYLDGGGVRCVLLVPNV